MANVERLRNVEEQISTTTETLTNDFKRQIQSILSENQLLISKKIENDAHFEIDF